MSSADREQLVERYLLGALSASEEEEFFMRVAVDVELRRTLRAYQIVDSSIRKEREGSAHGYSAARARLAASLAADSSPAPTTPASPDGSIFSRRWLALAAALTVGAGALIALQFGDDGMNIPERSTVAPAGTIDSGASIGNTIEGDGRLKMPGGPSAAEPPLPAQQRPNDSLRASRPSITMIDTAARPANVDVTRAQTSKSAKDSVLRHASPSDSVRLPIELEWD